MSVSVVGKGKTVVNIFEVLHGIDVFILQLLVLKHS